MECKDTTPVKPPATVSPFRERKLKADGSEHVYETELLHRETRVVVVRFVMTRGGGPPMLPIRVESGAVSYGYFWPKRPYNLYRMIGLKGEVLAHRFDAVTDVRVTAEEVSYRDLVLDWWALPDGTLTEEDRDELDELRAAGAITEADCERANEAARQVYSRYRHIIDEAEMLQRRFAPGP